METKFSLEIVLSTLRSLLNSLRWLVKKVPIIVWKSTGIVILVLISSAVTALVVTKSTLPPPPSPSPVALVRKGGIDLQTYCEAYGYVRMQKNDVNGNTICSSDIDLNKACDWTYKSKGLRFGLKQLDNPDSGTCYDSDNVPKGGINDMSGYCVSAAKGNTGAPYAIVVECQGPSKSSHWWPGECPHLWPGQLMLVVVSFRR